MSDTFTAMQLTKLGAPLEPTTLTDQPLGPDQVRIGTRACGLNFGDLLVIDGTYQEKREPPFTPGMEIAGVVLETGANATALHPGQRIAAYIGFGGFAQHTVVEASQCVPVPDTMTDVQAAAFLVAYGTSHVALVHRARIKPGERLLVLGAAGGVGLTAVELGKQLGAEVIACARGQDKLAIAKQAGADHLIDSDTDDIRDTVKSLGGADVVYDPVGGHQFKAALRACNPEARILPLGFASGEVPQIPANIILVKNISVLGFYWGGYARFAPHVLTESFAALMDMFAAGRITPHVSHTFSLHETNDALATMRERRSTGKIVVTTD